MAEELNTNYALGETIDDTKVEQQEYNLGETIDDRKVYSNGDEGGPGGKKEEYKLGETIDDRQGGIVDEDGDGVDDFTIETYKSPDQKKFEENFNFEEYKKNVEILDKSGFNYTDIVTGGIFFDNEKAGPNFNPKYKGTDKTLEAFFSILQDEEGLPLIDDIRKLKQERDKQIADIPDQDFTNMSRSRVRNVYAAQSSNRYQEYPGDRINKEYNTKVKNLINSALLNPENQAVVDRYVTKGANNLETAYNVLNLQGNPALIYDNEKQILEHNISSFLLDESKNLNKESLKRAEELSKSIVTKEANGEDATKERQERKELIQKFYETYKVEDAELLYDPSTKKIYRDETPPPDVKVIKLSSTEYAKRIVEQAYNEQFDRNSLEDYMIDLHYKIAAIGSKLNPENPFIRGENWWKVQTPEGEIDIEASQGMFRDKLINSQYKMRRLDEAGNSFPVQLYNQYIDELNVLTDAYYLNFDPIKAFEKSGFKEGIRQGTPEAFTLLAKMENKMFGRDDENWKYGLTADDFQQTFVTAMKKVYGDNFKISDEEFDEIKERNWSYHVGYGFPGFVKMGLELAAAAGIGNAVGVGAVFAEMGILAETMFAGSRTTRAAIKTISHILEEGVKLGIYNEVVLPGVNAATGGKRNTDEEKISYWFSALGGINYGYSKFVDYLMKPAADGAPSALSNMISKVESYVMGSTVTTLAKGPIQATTGAGLITMGGVVEGGAELIQGEITGEQFKQQYLSLNGFTQTAAMCFLMKGFSPLKGTMKVVDAFVADTRKANSRWFDGRLQRYAKSLDLPVADVKDYKNVAAAEKVIDKAVEEKLDNIKMPRRLYKYFADMNIDLSGLSKSKNFVTDLVNVVNGQRNKLIERLSEIDATQDQKDQILLDFNQKAEAVIKASNDSPKAFQKGMEYFDAGNKTKLYLEQKQFLENYKKAGYGEGGSYRTKLQNLVNGVKKGNLTAQDILTMQEMGSANVLSLFLKENGVKGNSIKQAIAEFPGYMVLIESANKLGFEPGSKERNIYLQDNLKLSKLKSELEVLEMYNKNAVGLKKPTAELEAKIENLDNKILNQQKEGIRVGKEKAQQYINKVKQQTEAAGGQVRVFNNKDATIKFLQMQKGSIPDAVYRQQMKILTDPTKRVDAFNIVDNKGNTVRVFDMSAIFTPKKMKVGGKTVEYIDVTAGPHEPIHDFVNATIKTLGIEGNEAKLSEFVDSFRATMTNSELRRVEKRVKEMVDYKENPNTLEWFNAYAELLATGEIKFPEGTKAEVVAENFNRILEEATGKNFDSPEVSSSVEAIKTIIDGYVKDLVTNPESQPEIGRKPVVDKFLEVSYKEDGHYTGIQNKADIVKYENKAKDIRTKIAEREQLIRTLEAEDPIFNEAEIQALKNANERDIEKANRVTSNTEKARINLENIKILANPESTLREKRDAENAILENNVGLRQQLKNRFKPELVQEKDVSEARRNWDAQVDFYFSQLLTKHLNTYKRAQAQGVDYGELFYDVEAKGGPKTYVLAEFGAYATFLKEKYGDVIKNYGGETNVFKVFFENEANEGGNPGINPEKIASGGEQNVITNIKPESKEKVINYTFYPKSTKASSNIVQIATIDAKNPKDFNTQAKNLIRDNSGETYEALIGSEKAEAEIAKLDKPTKADKDRIKNEVLVENLMDLYPDFVEIVEAEGEFMRLRKGVFSNFYESTGVRTQVRKPDPEKGIPGKEDYVYIPKFTSQSEFVDLFTKGDQRTNKRNLENLAWMLDLSNTKKAINETLSLNDGVIVVDNKGVNIFNPFSKTENVGYLVKEMGIDAYENMAEIKADAEGSIQNKATTVTPELEKLVDNAFKDLEKNGVKKYDYNQATAIVSQYEIGSREYEEALNEPITLSTGKKTTVGDVFEMFDVAVTDQIKQDAGEVVSIVKTTQTRIKDGKANETLYDEKNVTKEDFETILNQNEGRGKVGAENQKNFGIVTKKVKKTIEKEVNGKIVKETIVTKEPTINKNNYDNNIRILGDFVKKLPTREQLNGTGVSLDALVGDHMRTTGMGTTLLDPATGKTVSVGKIIETLKEKGIEPGQEPDYYKGVDFDAIISEGKQQQTSKKLLSREYTKEQKDEMYEETYTNADSKARQKLLEGLLLAKFDFVWAGENTKAVLERYDAMVKISKSESDNKKGQRVLASIIGAMYRDLAPEDVWVKLEHSTASVDYNSKMLDLIARGDREGIIQLAKEFEGVYGQRGNRKGTENPDNVNFDMLDTELGTTNPNVNKLMAVLPADPMMVNQKPVKLADVITVRNDKGELQTMGQFTSEVASDVANNVSKKYPISPEFERAVKNDIQNDASQGKVYADASKTKKLIENKVKTEAANTARLENDARIEANNQSETVSVNELQNLSKDNLPTNQLENATFIDAIMDTNGEQAVDITFNDSGNKYTFNPENSIAIQPNTKGSFAPKRKVILMAGSAGSGKSGIIKQYYKYLKDNNFDVSEFEYLNVDGTKERLIEEFGIEKDQNKQDIAERSLDARFMSMSRKEQEAIIEEKIANGDGFVLDGTLASYRNTTKLIKRLEDAGYDVTIVKADATLESKLDRNRKRKERVLRDKIVTKNHEQVEDAFIKYEADGRKIIKVNTNELKINELPVEIAKDIFSKTNDVVITKVDAVRFENEPGSIQNKANLNKVTVSANDLISERFKMDTDATYTEAEATKAGAGRRRSFKITGFKSRHALPLLLEIIGKGDRKGLEHMEYGLDLFDQGKYNYASYKRNASESFKGLQKLNKENGIDLKLKDKMSKDSVFNREDAVRIYLWNKNGVKVPGLGDKSKNLAIETVINDPQLLAYSRQVEAIFKYGSNDYYQPEVGWSTMSMKGDLMMHIRNSQKEFMQPFKDYMDATFTTENLNKIKAGFKNNKDFDAWWFSVNDFIDRGYTGRTRAMGEPVGQKFVNWWHGATALALGGNVKSMFTQLISSSIYINARDNSFIQAARAYANPEIFKAMRYIMKSDYLKDRRGTFDLALKEIKDASSKFTGGIYDKALNLSFFLSQVGDNAAIIMGGSSMLLNKANRYMKEGMSEEAAYEKAMFEVAQFTESTQQSTWARNLNYEQTTAFGKMTLNFLNTNILYNNGALAEAMKIKRGLGDKKSAQIIFNRIGLQTAMFTFLSSGAAYNLLDDEIDEETRDEKWEADKEYATWNAMVNVINGTGIRGKFATTAMTTLKNQYESMTEEGKRNADIAMDMLQASPALSIKIKKLKSMTYDMKQAQKIYEKTGKVPSKQLLRAATKLFSFGTNIVWPEYVTTLQDKLDFLMQQRYTFAEKWEAAISSVYAGNKDYYKDRNKREMQEAMEESTVPVQKTPLGGTTPTTTNKNTGYKPKGKRKPLGAK